MAVSYTHLFPLRIVRASVSLKIFAAYSELCRTVSVSYTHLDVYKRQGLGLSICEQIAQVHQAQLQIGSAPGKGTVIRIIFPEI